MSDHDKAASRLTRISSEAQLQLHLKSLFERMPNIRNVRLLQGPDEHGKDIVFTTDGPLGEELSVACVVKNTPIRGNIRSNSGARTVLYQARQALDTPYNDTTGADVHVQRVYVITPYEISPAAIAAIKGELLKHPGQVVFFAGSQLTQLFAKHWPEFLAEEASAVQDYLSKLASGVDIESALYAVLPAFGTGTAAKSILDVYVDPSFRRSILRLAITPTLISLVPSDIQFDSPGVRRGLETCQTVLLHLEEWGYLWPDSAQHGVFRDVLEKSLLQLRQNRDKKHAANGLAKTTDHHGDDLFGSQVVNLHRSWVEACTRKFDEHGKRIGRGFSKESATLTNPEFRAACTLADCFGSAPSALFARTSPRPVTFESSVLDNYSGSLIVDAPAGFGKTALCRRRALRDIEQFNSGNADTVPVYVPLYAHDNQDPEYLRKLLDRRHVRSALLSRARGEKSIEQARTIRVYLDGLDEIADSARQRGVVEIAQRAVERDDGYEVLITSRPHVQGAWLQWLPRISLAPLSLPQAIELARKWYGGDDELTAEFSASIAEEKGLAEVVGIPLLATITALVFRQTRRLPNSKTRLYENFIDLLSGGWDLAKRVQRNSRFEPEKKRLVLGVLAARTHERRAREFGTREITAAIEDTLGSQLISKAEEIKNELLVDGVITTTGEAYLFSHFSFQEYLCAKDLAGLDSRRTKKAVQQYLQGDDWWLDVLLFRFGMTTRPQELVQWLLAEIDKESDNGAARDRADTLIKGVRALFPEFMQSEFPHLGVSSTASAPQ